MREPIGTFAAITLADYAEHPANSVPGALDGYILDRRDRLVSLFSVGALIASCFHSRCRLDKNQRKKYNDNWLRGQDISPGYFVK